MTFNCRGIGTQEKRRDVINYLKKLDFDIYFLQDTHLIQTNIPYINTIWPGKCYHSCGTRHSRGTSILFKHNIQHNIIHEEYCNEGNYVIIICKVFINTYTLVNIYGPNDDRPSFFDHLSKRLDDLPTENLIVGGDFNFVSDYTIDSNYSRQNNPRAKKAFSKLIEQYELLDTWRQMNPNQTDGFTWTRRNPLKYGRLDRLYIQEHLISNIISSNVISGYRSDHKIVSLNIVEPQKKRGPGLWKLNDSLLEGKDYNELVRRVVSDVVQQYAIPLYTKEFMTDSKNFGSVQLTISDSLFYETLLMMIRGETVRFSKSKARQRREDESRIMAEINKLNGIFSSRKGEEDLERLEDAQRQLEEIRKPIIQGLITRSRVNWYEEGEKCSKYFLSLEKRNAERNSIHCLKYQDRLITNKEEIIKHFSDNLQSKYLNNVDRSDPRDYLLNSITSKLSDRQRDVLDKPLSIQELHSALLSMKKGRSPGSNGFTSSFFRHFWDVVGIFLFRAVNEGLQNGTAILSHCESVVTLIPKQGKPRDLLKGWRPISLLNVDFKIISSAIANRLKMVMDDLISPTQTAYIPGRFIGENSRLTYDVIEHVRHTSSTGIIMAVDFEAAFDTVSWEFLEEALKCYNFGPYCLHMIKTLYLNSNNFSRILLDGCLGGKIRMERGVRQGDPASGYLFNLVMEPLTNQILQSNSIEGILLSNENEVRLSQYADDLIIFSQAKENSVRAVLQTLDNFSTVSGLRVNVEKTNCLPIGKPRSTTFINDLGLKVVNELKILGILYNSLNTDIVQRNVSEILPKMDKEIAQWKRRHLTLIGRITVIKSLVISKVVHILTTLPNPDIDTIKHINKMMFKYIWRDGPDKIKRKQIVQNYDRDGLKMIDLQSFIKSLKISWIKRLYWAKPNVTWANRVKECLPPICDLVCYGSDKLQELSKNIIKNTFWRDVINAWADFNKIIRLTSSQIMTEKIWFSRYTKFKKSIVREWDAKGLRFIADLYSKDTGLLLNCEEINKTFDIKMTFLCYQSLIRSILLETDANTIKEVTYPIMPYKITLLFTKSIISRIAYCEFINAMNKTLSDHSSETLIQRKWRRDIGYNINGTLRDIRSSTSNTYLQAFHYRIVTRIIATNTFLFRIGRSETPLCTFCKLCNETLIHILWECEIVQTFIKEVITYLKDSYNAIIQYNMRSWIFPRTADLSDINIIAITLIKLVIFKSKYKGRRPCIGHFHALLKTEAEKEDRSAARKNISNIFLQKWKNVSKILTSATNLALT